MQNLEKLLKSSESTIKLGLGNIKALLQALGNPENSFPSIHIGGTNGKGSVATKLAKIYENGGYKTALYTSPHIFDFKERFMINGEMIEEKRLNALVEKVMKTGILATFFELTTACAFLYFAEEKVDLAVIEVGLGGRFDATNVITPLVSIITSVSLDHAEYLGDTLEKIAYEKGGIIKENVPVITSCDLPLEVISTISQEKQAPLHIVKGNFSSKELQNQALAKKCTELLSNRFTPGEGLTCYPPCRFQKIGDLIMDVAHNEASILELLKNLKKEHPRWVALFSLSKSKVIKPTVYREMESFFLKIYWNPTEHERLTTFDELQSRSALPLIYSSTIEEALAKARKEAKDQNALVAVFGSFFSLFPPI